MATTTNYSWTTPDDTSLVKDGAAAIRTLGSSIDTTTKALNPSTTLGDIEYRSATANTNTRLGIGTTGQVLQVTGGVPVWGAAPAAAAAKTYTLLSTVSSSAVTSLSFSSLSGKDSYILMWQGVYFNSFGNDFRMRLNNNSGTNYNYVRQGKDLNYPTGGATGNGFYISYTGTSSVPTNGAAFIEGANGTGGKTLDLTAIVSDGVTGSTLVPINVSGVCNLSTTLTSIDLNFTSTWSAGTFYLWGA